jgi:DNA-directed RNA polymerase specialized sigma24 family protein
MAMSVVAAGHVDLRDARRSRAALVSRPAERVLTDNLQIVWPEVAARLAAMLRRRGVKHHDVDEIVQETAARAISTRVPYADADDLFRWAAVVGGRLAIDLHRRGWRMSDDELPDRADTVDVAMTAEHRVVLGAVRSRLTELSVVDQEALLSGFSDQPARSRRESVRTAVARHRARNRLRALLDGLAGSAILLWVRRCRVWSAPAEAIASAAMPAAACLVISIGAWSGVSQPQADDSAATTAPPAQVVVAHPRSSASTLTAPEAAAENKGEPRPAPRPASVPRIPPTDVTVAGPDGGHARTGVRPKQESDHLWCVTPPPGVGPGTQCVDSPVTLPPH